MRIAVGGLNFKHAIADFQNGNIKRAAAQIVNGDLFVLLLVETVSERRGRRLIDNAKHFETGNATGVFRGLTLRVVEIGRNRDDRLRDLFAQTRFSVGLELGKNHRGNFLGGELLGFALDFDFHGAIAIGRFHDLVRHALNFFADFIKLAAHETLDGVNRVAGVRNGLTLRRIADDALAGFGKRHDGRRGTFAFGIFEHERFAAVHDGHAGVRGA